MFRLVVWVKNTSKRVRVISVVLKESVDISLRYGGLDIIFFFIFNNVYIRAKSIIKSAIN